MKALLILLATHQHWTNSQQTIFNDVTSFLEYRQSLHSCYEKFKPLQRDGTRGFFMANATDADTLVVAEWRRVVTRCIRGIPYNEHPSPSPSKFLNSSSTYFFTNLYPKILEDINDLKNNNPNPTVPPAISSIDNPAIPPSSYLGRGNFLMTSIHQLEHEYEQLVHLVEGGKLPREFFAIAMRMKYQIIPVIASVLEEGCAYFGPGSENNNNCGPNIRLGYYMLDEWMLRLMSGLHNRLVYQPVDVGRSTSSPSALNSDLDFNKIQNSYLNGDVVAIDNFLSRDGLHHLRTVALDSTTFFDAKLGYLGSYQDDGLSSSWLDSLGRELQERLPKILNNLPLRQAWMYKYDSYNAKLKQGIRIHADQATVNLNIWLTPDDANLGVGNGGLIIHNAAAPEQAIFSTDGFNSWNGVASEGRMHAWLLEKGVGNVTVPYRYNRCVMFNSALLHETDHFEFKKDYRSRRINLTLLFGNFANANGDESLKNVASYVT